MPLLRVFPLNKNFLEITYIIRRIFGCKPMCQSWYNSIDTKMSRNKPCPGRQRKMLKEEKIQMMIEACHDLGIEYDWTCSSKQHMGLVLLLPDSSEVVIGGLACTPGDKSRGDKNWVAKALRAADCVIGTRGGQAEPELSKPLPTPLPSSTPQKAKKEKVKKRAGKASLKR